MKYLDNIAEKLHSGKGMDVLRQLFDPLFEIMQAKLNAFSFGDIAIAAHASLLSNIFQGSGLLVQVNIFIYFILFKVNYFQKLVFFL